MHFYSLEIFKKGIVLVLMGLTAQSFTSNSPQLETSLRDNRTEDIRRLSGKEIVADFRGVARVAIPAVVSIKVQKKSLGNGNLGDDSFDFFGGDLWNFFGIPHKDLRSRPTEGQASGVIVSPNGYILTNSHVVHEMENIIVQLNDGREFPAKVLGDDTNSELALIKIDADQLPYLSLGNSDDLEVGQWVAAIGNPFSLHATLTVGVVSAKSRNNLDITRYEDFIQTDAAINRGNSGGPLVTLNGEVIGINTAIATTAASGYVGIGFAIPSNMAKNFMDQILSNGKVSRGFLGIGLQSLDYNLAKLFGLNKTEGALITNVTKNSAAEKAGLQVEDIILKINDRSVENAASLRNAVSMLKPGSEISLMVLRKDRYIQIPVSVGEFSEAIAVVEKGKGQTNAFGIEVSNMTPEIAQKLGIGNDQGLQGVVVTQVSPSSTAAMAGLKKGALILAVNRQKVTNVDEFNKILVQAQKDRSILLQIKQGDIYLFLSLQGVDVEENN